jgi:hypothetical protein
MDLVFDIISVKQMSNVNHPSVTVWGNPIQ